MEIYLGAQLHVVAALGYPTDESGIMIYTQQIEMGMKHSIIQDVVVNQVYLGGDPPLVEKFGFGKGPTGYATMQYVMAFHENDPLCQQYTSSSMSKIWLSAGLDLNTAT